jgi:hypothetical protein
MKEGTATGGSVENFWKFPEVVLVRYTSYPPPTHTLTHCALDCLEKLSRDSGNGMVSKKRGEPIIYLEFCYHGVCRKKG